MSHTGTPHELAN